MEVSEGPSAPDAVDAATPEGALEEVWQALRNHYPMLERSATPGWKSFGPGSALQPI